MENVERASRWIRNWTKNGQNGQKTGNEREVWGNDGKSGYLILACLRFRPFVAKNSSRRARFRAVFDMVKIRPSRGILT